MKIRHFKRYSALLAALCILILCVGCSEKAPADGTGEKSSGESPTNGWQQVEKADKPQIKSGSFLTSQELRDTYEKYLNWQIYAIRTSETKIKPADGGTAYYVSNSGDDKNDGTSPEKAIETLANINKLPLKAGDVVYLERGGIWRGSIFCNTEGVSYSAYGSGKKPEIYSSPMNAANKEYWDETENENIYLFNVRRFSDVGTLVLDDSDFALKYFWEPIELKSKKPSDLNKNLSFTVTRSGQLYFRCEQGNPGEVYSKIEININETTVSVRKDNITLDNLCFKYTGNHCISGNDIKGLTVQNCEIGFVGGCVQGGLGNSARYGNGVEIWGSATDFTVKNNYFYQIYDSAATFQYRDSDKIKKDSENILFADNVFDSCTSSIEYWVDEDCGTISDFTIDNNFLWNCGMGLGSQRPSRSGSIHLTSGGMANDCVGPFKITNNIIALSAVDLIYITPKSGDYPEMDGNTFIQTYNGRFGRYRTQTPVIRFDDNILSIIENDISDKNATVVFIKDDK